MKKILRYFWPAIVSQKWVFFLCLFLAIISVSLDVVYPFYYKELADFFSFPPNQDSFLGIEQTFFKIFLLYAAMWIVWRGFEFCIALFEARGMREIENRCFVAIERKNMAFFENSFSGSLVKKAGRFVRAFEAIIDWFFFWGLRGSFHLFFVLAIFLFTKPLFGLLVGLWILLFLGGNILFALWKIRFDRELSAADSLIGGAFADSFSNILTVKGFARELAEEKRISNLSQSLFKKRITTWMLQNANFAVQAFLMLGLELLLIFFMIQEWKKGEFSAGDFVFFQAFIIEIFTRLWDFGRSLRDLFTAFADASEMAEIFEIPSEHKESLSLEKKLPHPKGEICFEQVRFCYEKESPTFEDFSLLVPSGQKVGLVGHSGAGKTTIAKMLLRFIELSGGKIMIDGVDTATLSLFELRSHISLVPQTPELFHRTIRENISFGNKEVGDDQIWEAAKKARAAEFIQKMPNGLDTLVGERGVKLSGGERQRIAIARAFLKDSPIVILDEATSALDSITERKIQAAIFELLKGKTAFVIAHRLSTILQMDRILLLEGGKIVEDGSHKELVAKRGLYEKLWRHQSGDFFQEEHNEETLYKSPVAFSEDVLHNGE